MQNLTNAGKTIELSDGSKVIVRQMPFLKAIEFTKKLSALAGQLIDEKGKFKLAKNFPGAHSIALPGGDPTVAPGSTQIDLTPLAEIIQNSGELMTFLIMNSIRDVGAEFMDQLAMGDGLAILTAAIEQNLSPEILKLGNGLAGALRQIIPTTRKPANTTATQ